MKRTALLISTAFSLLLAGCDLNPGPFPKGDTNLGHSFSARVSGEYTVLSIRNDQPGAKADVSFQGKVAEGTLGLQVVSPSGAVVQELGTFSEYLSWNARIELPETGEYRMVVSWDSPVSADVSGGWKLSSLAMMSKVEPQALIGGGGMVLAALMFIGFAFWRRWSLKYLLLGMLAWVVTVVVKFAIALPANPPLLDWLQTVLPFEAAVWPFSVYVGLLTGLTEVLLLWLALRFTRFGRATLQEALAFGFGFGAVEALILGVPNLLSAAVFSSMPAGLESTPGILPAAFQVAQLNNILIALAPVVERIMVILIHIVCSVWLFDSAIRRNRSGLVLAFVWKSAVDSVAAFAQMWGLFSMERIWLVESIIVVFGLVSAAILAQLIRNYPPSASAVASTLPVDTPAGS